MPVTIRDVALAAGVSTKTVSNVLNDYPYLRPATRERVQAAIQELGFRPNPSARRLRHGRTGLIGLALPDLTAPYFSALAHEIGRAAAQHDWTVIIEETGGRRNRELDALGDFGAQPIDGIVLSPMALGEDALRAVDTPLPMVLLGGQPEQLTHDHVAVDHLAAVRAATEHLIERGRTRIAYLGAVPPGAPVSTASLRADGYRSALAAAGLAHDPRIELPLDGWARPSGADGARRLIASGIEIDGIICANDVVALGAMSALLAAGIRIPHDVALVGFDDIEDGRFATPSLSTINQGIPALATHSLELLAERVGGDHDSPPRRVRVPFELMVRGSSDPGAVAA